MVYNHETQIYSLILKNIFWLKEILDSEAAPLESVITTSL